MGRRLGVDLFTGHLFVARLDATPLDQAAEALDEGVIFLTWGE